MTMWQPGMRCVCVDASASIQLYSFEMRPTKGKVYTVRDVVTGPDPVTGREVTGLHLEEIVNPVFRRSGGVTLELAFAARRFRPLSETRLDQFKAHLVTPPREKVDA